MSSETVVSTQDGFLFPSNTSTRLCLQPSRAGARKTSSQVGSYMHGVGQVRDLSSWYRVALEF